MPDLDEETTVAEDAEWMRNVAVNHNALVRVHAGATENFQRIADRFQSLASDNLRLKEALADAREAIASLDEFALGGVDIADTYTGDCVGQYGIRDELLSKIDNALSHSTKERE